MNITEMVKGTAEFEYYRDGNLWYSVTYIDTSKAYDPSHEYEDHPESKFIFPVPISDIGNATFNRSDKGILFMRYIRKHIALQADAAGALAQL